MKVRFYNIVWGVNAPDIFFLWQNQGVDGEKEGFPQYGMGSLEDIIEAAAAEKGGCQKSSSLSVTRATTLSRALTGSPTTATHN